MWLRRNLLVVVGEIETEVVVVSDMEVVVVVDTAVVVVCPALEC